jgi:hypothetical protein
VVAAVAEALGMSRSTVDARIVLDAAGRAQAIFDD